jgi:beta-lactamase class A
MIGSLEAPATVGWSVCVRDVARGEVIAAVDEDVVRPVASVGKVLLLIEVARRFEAGELERGELLGRDGVEAVGDSGLWQHLEVEALPAADVAALVGAVSDNLATNVLLERVGLDAVARTARAIGLTRTALHDRVRDPRTAEDSPQLSTATAAELATLFAGLANGTVVSERVSRHVRRWLAVGTDLSMVASAFGLDPLAHHQPDRGIVLWSKTGTDAGIRAEAGVVARGDRALSYAGLASWPPRDDDGPRDAVLAALRRTGEALADRLRPAE